MTDNIPGRVLFLFKVYTKIEELESKLKLLQETAEAAQDWLFSNYMEGDYPHDLGLAIQRALHPEYFE